MQIIRFNILLCGLVVSVFCAFCFLALAIKNYNDITDELVLRLQIVNSSRSYLSNSRSRLHIRVNPCKQNVTGHGENEIYGRSRKCIKDTAPSMLTAEGDGRLGNQMLCYATMFAIARYNNRRAYMSPKMSDFISKYFNVISDTLSQKLLESNPWIDKRVGGVVDDSIRNLTQPYVRLSGVPQAWKYFDELRPLIQNQFQFHDEIKQRAKIQLKRIRNQFFRNVDQITVTVVGIHVRRGDYISSSQIGGFHVPGMEFYTGAMLYFEERYNNVIFVVASDDIQWCAENFEKLRAEFRIHLLESDPSEDTAGLDLATLTHCDHVIYGLGSFGFWAGYLTPGEVIFCSDCMTSTAFWLRDKNVYNGDYGNAVLPSWIGYSRNGTETSRSVLAHSDDLI